MLLGLADHESVFNLRNQPTQIVKQELEREPERLKGNVAGVL